jgi:hypothetical protein
MNPMPKLKKSILPVGEYLVSTSNGGRTPKKFEEKLLREISQNANKMIEAGLRIPAPFKHLKEALPTEVVDTNSFDNGGYWESFEIEIIKNVPTLVGVIDAPGDVNDMRTPAGKLQNTIKEVSACVKESWTDGKGRSWGPCILHVAPVLHPIVPGQEGFSLVENAIALSVSDTMSEGNYANLAELSKQLMDDANIYIPPDTMVSDLPKVLSTVLRQKKLSESEKENDDTEVVHAQSIFMSHEEPMKVSKQVADVFLASGAINPKTQKPYVKEDFTIEKDPMETYALAITGQFTQQRKTSLRERTQILIKEGKLSEDYAKANIYPQIDTYELSLGDNATFKASAIDLLIESLEKLPAIVKPSNTPSNKLPADAQVLNLSADEGGDLTAEQAETMKKSLLSLM